MEQKKTKVYGSISTPNTIHASKRKSAAEENKADRSLNEIEVIATGECSQKPDRCRVLFCLSSTKPQVQDAKNSVSRRLDYILQTLHNKEVPDSAIEVSKILKKYEGKYEMYVEVKVIFVGLSMWQSICNFLVEKLDDSVKVGSPEFFQDSSRLENLRKQATLLAVKNSKSKAIEIAKCFNGTVGKPLSIKEEYCNEAEGPADVSCDPEELMTIQQKISNATVTVSAKVSVVYELKYSKKSKNVT